MSLTFLEVNFKDIVLDVDALLEESASLPEEEKGRLYFLLVNTQTIVSKMISAVTNAPYTHISVAFDEKLEEIFSFNVDVNGMKQEILEKTYALKNRMSVYFIELPKSVIQQIRDRVHEMFKHSKRYTYDMVSIAKFLIPRKVREYMGIETSDEKRESFICSQFASWLLLAHNIKLFSRKDNMLLAPYDFMKSRVTKLYFRGTVEGFIKRYR